MRHTLEFLAVLVVVSAVGFAACGDGAKKEEVEKEPKQEEKKTQKSKYDFNIFKLYSIAVAPQISDSLKTNIKAQPKFRKED